MKKINNKYFSFHDGWKEAKEGKNLIILLFLISENKKFNKKSRFLDIYLPISEEKCHFY